MEWSVQTLDVGRSQTVLNSIVHFSLKPFDSSFESSFVTHTMEPYYNVANSIFGFPTRSKFLRHWLLDATELSELVEQVSISES